MVQDGMRYKKSSSCFETKRQVRVGWYEHKSDKSFT